MLYVFTGPGLYDVNEQHHSTSAPMPNTSYLHANNPSHNTLANNQNLGLELCVGQTRHKGLKKALWDAYSVKEFGKGGCWQIRKFSLLSW